MPWINLTMRRGALTKEMQHAVMAKLTDTLMFWEKIPDTPEARKKMNGWVQGPFRIDPIYDEEKVVFLRPDIAETYAPVKSPWHTAARIPLQGHSSWCCYGSRRRKVGGWRRTFRSPFRQILGRDEGHRD